MPFFIGMMAGIFQQVSGIMAIVFYSNTIFEEAAGKDSAPLFTLIAMVCQTLGTFGTGLIIERFGRKTLLIIGYSIGLMSLLLLVAQLNFGWQPIISVFAISIYMLGFGLAAGPITWLYMADVLPDFGVAISVCNTWIFTSLNGYFFPKF